MANGNDFKPQGKYSSATLTSEYVLNTEHAQRVHRRCFEGAARALFTIDVIARALSHGNKSFNYSEVMAAVETTITSLETEIIKERDRFKAILEANGSAGVTARYDNAAHVSFTVSTPLIMRLAQIIQAFDQMLIAAQTCWLMCYLPSDKNELVANERMRQVMRVIRKLQLMATEARNKAKADKNAAEIAVDLGDANEENDIDKETASAIEQEEAAAKNAA
ncbi:hypothetical protein [Pseudomonas sp. LS-2]|uniref:hypothetical protein n=1 Tax=Pseudomonas sp. LS-2 TaxID=2315859 RepID=UPI000E70DEDA|nr:hypothetical protein [Pseudomonas sp. LS-2]RJX72636.1 hypothetical protein D3M70_31025 [Pseudomonas sp. LS-2]